MPEEQVGAVYGSGDGSLTLANYQSEKTTGTVSGLNGLSSSIFLTRSGSFVFAASQASHVFTVVNRANGSAYPLSLPGVYRVSVNPGGTMALAFVQNSNYAYYPRQLTAAQTVCLFRRTLNLAQGRSGLRAAKCASLVPVPGAEPRRGGRDRKLVWRAACRSTVRSRRSSRPTAVQPTC